MIKFLKKIKNKYTKMVKKNEFLKLYFRNLALNPRLDYKTVAPRGTNGNIFR